MAGMLSLTEDQIKAARTNIITNLINTEIIIEWLVIAVIARPGRFGSRIGE